MQTTFAENGRVGMGNNGSIHHPHNHHPPQNVQQQQLLPQITALTDDRLTAGKFDATA